VAGKQENQPGRGLTPRSTGAPTAGHQARAGGTRYIFTGRALASCRCRPLSSNVRPCMGSSAHLVHTARPSGPRPWNAGETSGRSQGQEASACSLPVPRSSDERRTASARCRHGRQRFAGSFATHASTSSARSARTALGRAVPRLPCSHAPCALLPAGRPNPSVKARPNGMPPGPRGAFWFIMHRAGLASYRRSRLTSNVRPRMANLVVCQQNQRLSARTEQPQGGTAA
jgi:hypothetical protein